MLKKVLIVEDFDDSRSFMKIAIESYGYSVVEASDGLEALDQFRQQHPDIILMDISLPMVDGIISTKAIREIDGKRNIPIIAITAFGNTYKNQVIEAGCTDFLAKPVDLDKLKAMLNKYLNQSADELKMFN